MPCYSLQTVEVVEIVFLPPGKAGSLRVYRFRTWIQNGEKMEYDCFYVLETLQKPLFYPQNPVQPGYILFWPR